MKRMIPCILVLFLAGSLGVAVPRDGLAGSGCNTLIVHAFREGRDEHEKIEVRVDSEPFYTDSTGYVKIKELGPGSHNVAINWHGWSIYGCWDGWAGFIDFDPDECGTRRLRVVLRKIPCR